MFSHTTGNKAERQTLLTRILLRNMIELSLSSLNSLWFSAQSTLPINIFNFSVKHINNTLAAQSTSTNGYYRLHLTASSA